jgi:thiol:disulfide interchange protein DsbD
MTRLSSGLTLLALLLAASPALAQKQSKFAQVATVRAEVVPAKAKRGETVTYRFTVAPNPGYWTYPVKPGTGQASVTALDPPSPDVLVFVGEPKELGEWAEKDDEMNPLQKVKYSKKPVTWEFKAVVSPNAEPGKKYKVKLDRTTSLQVCDDQACIPSTERDLPEAEFEVEPGDPVPIDPQYRDAVEKALARSVKPPPGPRTGNNVGHLSAPAGPPQPVAPGVAPHAGPKEPKPIEQIESELKAIHEKIDKSQLADTTQSQGIGAFVLTAALWGLISLVTPCVFPMIPITVSIFLKHAHGSFRERMKLAAVYSLTIIIVLGLSAFALLKFMALLSVHPVTNVLLGVLFVVLALSLFGMYELTLPNFMVKRLQTKQAQGGVVGTIFGALAFTVISFTCVAPFLGGFAGISAASSTGEGLFSLKYILGGLAFATAFAAPFFVLALIPGLLKALPKSGGWLDSVKVVMGFLELAAALKFFRTAELGVFSPTEYFTFDLVLAGWVGIAFACGLYLLNAYRLPHDEEKPNIGVMRLLFALLFLGLGVYLLPAVFKDTSGKSQRPAGAVYAWVDAFLLPEPKHLGWNTDLHDAIEKVRADAKTGKAKPIIVDFTGTTCTNCKYNENTVFPQAKVNDLLDKFERVQLYTDWVPADLYATDPGERARRLEGLANGDFQEKVFGDIKLPLYAILLPTADGKVKVLSKYDEGKINSPDKFAAWLKDGLEKAKK